MMISTKGRYALRVMIDLAQHDGSKYIPLKDIAARQEISEKYLESIIAVLVKAEYVEGLRGKGGGYRLKRESGEYTVSDILTLTEGTLAPVACLEYGACKCKRAAECKTLPMWTEFYKIIKDYFSGITLADLVNTQSAGDDYTI